MARPVKISTAFTDRIGIRVCLLGGSCRIHLKTIFSFIPSI